MTTGIEGEEKLKLSHVLNIVQLDDGTNGQHTRGMGRPWRGVIVEHMGDVFRGAPQFLEGTMQKMGLSSTVKQKPRRRYGVKFRVRVHLLDMFGMCGREASRTILRDGFERAAYRAWRSSTSSIAFKPVSDASYGDADRALGGCCGATEPDACNHNIR